MVEEEKKPISTNELSEKAKVLYEGLLRTYNSFYGSGKQGLDDKIKSLMKQGLIREQAIYKLAEEEKLTEKEANVIQGFTRKGEQIPLSDEVLVEKIKELYDGILQTYNGLKESGKQRLDKKIESFVKQGLSEEEAIFKLADKVTPMDNKSRKSLSFTIKCPECEKEMEPGHFMLYLGLYATGEVSSLWSIEKPKFHKKLGYYSYPIDTIKVMAMGDKERKQVLRGFRCANCEVITFKY